VCEKKKLQGDHAIINISRQFFLHLIELVKASFSKWEWVSWGLSSKCFRGD